MRLSFASATILLAWSLLAWWGAASSPTDRFKFGAIGAARIVNFDTDHSNQERCNWYTSGVFDQHCQPSQDGRWRIFVFRLGAPTLMLSLCLAVLGVFTLRRAAALAVLVATALAVVDIAAIVPATLAFANGRAVTVTGSGATAAVMACGFALVAIVFGSFHTAEPGIHQPAA